MAQIKDFCPLGWGKLMSWEWKGFPKQTCSIKYPPQKIIVWVLPKGQKSGLAGALEVQDSVASQNWSHLDAHNRSYFKSRNYMQGNFTQSGPTQQN